MSETNFIGSSQARAAFSSAGADRAAALAAARREARDTQLASAEQSRADQAVQIAEAREIIARAVGANTRLSIERRGDASTFIYRAIDQDTGEVIQEWPPEQFAAAVRQPQATPPSPAPEAALPPQADSVVEPPPSASAENVRPENDRQATQPANTPVIEPGRVLDAEV